VITVQLSSAQPNLAAMCSFHNFVIAFTIIIRTVSPTAMTDIAPTVTTGATDFGAISDNRGVVLGDASGM
jgi:hypothetical protein